MPQPPTIGCLWRGSDGQVGQ